MRTEFLVTKRIITNGATCAGCPNRIAWGELRPSSEHVCGLFHHVGFLQPIKNGSTLRCRACLNAERKFNKERIDNLTQFIDNKEVSK